MSEITRTEKFLRACIDGEPCALKPLTRVERLLAELNETLAGSPSGVVILPETELTPVPGEEGWFSSQNPLSATPTEGATAKVEYNGAEYECSVLAVPEAPFEAYALGNAEMMGIAGGNADAPFLVMLTPSGGEDDSYTTCVAMDGATTITLSIVQTEGAASGGESAGGGSGVFRVNAVVGSGNAITSCDKTVQGVLAAIAAGKQCEAVLSSGTLTIYLSLAMDAISAHSDPGASNGVTFTALLYAGSAILYNFTMYFNGNNTLDIKQF